MLKKTLVVLLLILLSRPLTAGDEFCGIRNYAFQSGEQISFTVFYNVIGLYVNAGTATFSVNAEKLNNEPVYHLVGEGTSNSRYDWIFKVRDKYESYIDTNNLQPIKFIRNVNEGGYKINENVSFNRQANTATSEKGTVKVPNCIQDVLSAIYYARNINFEKYKPEDKIPFTMFLDNEIFNLYIKYLGKETIKTRFGKFRAIKFKPLLVKGTLFEGGEKMTVWVSDDANHVPLRIESPIVVGSVKVDMMGYKNLRYPFSSMISER
ncbi:DUF3108 domain-containing protein [Sediminibacterium salmoneum]|uniref:DUF3108 domain-containing protein n=1 Tax=Sediminibacterium salmoneum TaxID=426421 RepID=UPI0004BBA76B|nr:DUF3108 domain-containing protein [Sediminibacterium salmoneum]